MHAAAPMKTLAAILLAFTAYVAAPQRAEASVARGEGPIELRPYLPVKTLEPERPEPIAISAAASLPPLRLREEREAAQLKIELPPLLPETLELSYRLERLELSVAADLSESDHPMTPRIDCSTRETYFWMRACFDVSDRLTLFAESFQGAGSILGGCVVPRWVWDGLELEAGVRARLTPRWTLEAGPVLYALSSTHRASHCGTRVSLSWDF